MAETDGGGLSNLNRQCRLRPAPPVDEVWGIGRRIGKKLEAMGIKTVLELADTDIRFIRKHFNVEQCASFVENPASNWRSLH